MPENVADALLQVEGLTVEFPFEAGRAPVVRDVSFDVAEGECLGIVGESGSGKTMTCLSLLRLVPSPGRIVSGSIRFLDHDLLSMSDDALRHVRGAQMSMVFQDPTAALNPLFTIGRQLTDVIVAHLDCSRAQARDRALEVLSEVGFSDPARRLGAYPFQLSGGLRQRVSIAMALVCRPRLVIADEPTTNLDVSIQAQIIDLLWKLKDEHGFAIIFISHDLGVVAHVADRVMIMYAGRLCESGPSGQVLNDPLHPYTQGLLRSAPTLEARRTHRLPSIPGNTPDLLSLPPGCPFTDRCEVAIEGVCREIEPRWGEVAPGRMAACHRVPPLDAEPIAVKERVSG